MDAEEYRKDLERKILVIIEEKLKNGQMSADRAKTIARMVLEKLHPPLTLEEIYTIAPTLDDHLSELTAAILPILQHNDEQLRTIVTQNAQKLIKSGKLDQAHQMLQSATEKSKEK